MKKTDFNDGICPDCGNSGLAGENCIVCGGMITKIDEGLSDPMLDGEDDLEKEPDVYPLDLVDEEQSGKDEEF